MRLWKRRKPLETYPELEREWFTVVKREPGLVLIETVSETGRKRRSWIPSQVKVDDVSV